MVLVQSPELWELWETRSVSGEFSKGCGNGGKMLLIFPPFPQPGSFHSSFVMGLTSEYVFYLLFEGQRDCLLSVARSSRHTVLKYVPL